VAFAARQAGIERGSVRGCGMRAWHQAHSLEPKSQRFPVNRRDDFVTSGIAKNEQAADPAISGNMNSW